MCQNTALQLLVNALPPEALRPLLLQLLEAQTNAAPAMTSAAPSADEHTRSDAVPTPAAPASHPGGRPKGSRNKPNATLTGGRAAARLAAMPGRSEMIVAVAAGTLTRAAAAKKFGTSTKTVGAWVARYRREQ